MNYRTGGLDIFAKGALTENDLYGKTSTIIQINGTDQWKITAEDIQTAIVRNLSTEVGFNYEINEHHSFGARYTPNGSLGDNSQHSWGENIALCNDMEVSRTEFDTKSQGKRGWNHSVNAYYAGKIGQWTIDFDADYLNNQSRTDQTAEDGSKQDIHSRSVSQSELYAAKLQASTSLGKGKLSFGSEGTLTERLATFTQSGYSADAHDLIKQKSFAGFANYSIVFGNRKQPVFYFDLDNSFTLPKGWFFNVQAYLQTASRQGFAVLHSIGQVDARISKSFLKDNAMTMTITANDIFRTGYDYFNVHGIDSYNGNKIYRDHQRIGLQLSYKFNATKSKYKGTGAGQSEKNRL